MSLQMKKMFLLLIILAICTSINAQTVSFMDESKTDNSFYQTTIEFSKLKPGDDWKKYFGDSVYYAQVGDRQQWVQPSALQKLIVPLAGEADLLKFFQHHFKQGFRIVNDSTADNEDAVFENELANKKTFCTYPLINDSLIRNGECNCVVLRDATIHEQPFANSKIISTIKQGCTNIGMHEYVASITNLFVSWWKVDINDGVGFILSDLLVPNSDYLVRIYWTLQNGQWKISLIYLPPGC